MTTKPDACHPARGKLTEQNKKEVLLGTEVEVQLVEEAPGHDYDLLHHFHVKGKCRQNCGISSSSPSLLFKYLHKLFVSHTWDVNLAKAFVLAISFVAKKIRWQTKTYS